jgi:hypothetical protein
MIWSRDELVFLLTNAAEVEHSLMCQYLYAAFSMKKRESEGLSPSELAMVVGWEQTVLMISRQEMEHLALVCNLLTAIGGAPHLTHPNFPQTAGYYPFPQALTPFTAATLNRFVKFEEPEPDRAPSLLTVEVADLPASPAPLPFATIGELYASIETGFRECPLTDEQLFTGPPSGQVGSMALQYLYPKSIQFMPGVFDTYMFPVKDRPSALKALELIVSQGEGGPTDPKFSHYQRFLEIRTQYEQALEANPDFVPGRPLVENPTLFLHPDATGANRITDPLTRQVLDLFNGCYETLLLLLIRFFSFTDETKAEVDALLYTFYPLMTMAIRPLGDMLTQMPAFAPATGELAGPSFETYPSLALLPHKKGAWTYLGSKLQTLAKVASDMAQTPGIPTRMPFLAENLQLISNRFQTLVSAQSNAQ